MKVHKQVLYMYFSWLTLMIQWILFCKGTLVFLFFFFDGVMTSPFNEVKFWRLSCRRRLKFESRASFLHQTCNNLVSLANYILGAWFYLFRVTYQRCFFLNLDVKRRSCIFPAVSMLCFRRDAAEKEVKNNRKI